MREASLLVCALLAFGCGNDQDPQVDAGMDDRVSDSGADLSGGEGGDLGTCATMPVSFNGNIESTFLNSCGGESCHIGFRIAPAGGLSLTQAAAYQNLVGVRAQNLGAAARNKLRVVKNDPDASFLWQKLTGQLASDEGSPMPLLRSALGNSELNAVRCWILAGAPDN